MELQEKHVKNTKFVINRDDLLILLPKNGIIAEIGVLEGEYSQKICNSCSPKELYLVDLIIQKEVTDYFKNQKDIMIIHLQRKNTLKMILSEKKAFKTNRWTNITGEEEERFAITIGYEECLHRFTQEREVKNQYDTYFASHRQINIAYEDLVNDHVGEMKRIQEFLGVGYKYVNPSTYKQSNQRLSKSILNYSKLKERFKETTWEEFFED